MLLKRTTKENLNRLATRLRDDLRQKASWACLEQQAEGCLWSVESKKEPLVFIKCCYLILEGIRTPFFLFWFEASVLDPSVYLKEAIEIAIKEEDELFVTVILDSADEQAFNWIAKAGFNFNRTIQVGDLELQLYQYTKIADTSGYGDLSTRFYDEEIATTNPQEIAFHEARLAETEGRALEAMCGSGRLLVPLLERGWSVDGIDNAPAMIKRCRKNCEQRGLSTHLFKEDLLQMNLPEKYGYIFVAIYSLHLLPGKPALKRAFDLFYHHLIKGGKLVFDMMLPVEALTAMGKPITETRQVESEGETIILDQVAAVDLQAKYYTMRQSFRLFDSNRCFLRKEENDLTFHWYARRQIEAMLSESGFELIACHNRPYQVYPYSMTYEAKAL